MARQFNGSSDQGNNSDLLAGVSTQGAFTFAAWGWPDSTSGGAHNIFATGKGGAYHAQVRRDGSDWNFYLRGVGVDNNATFAGGVTSGQWTHVAATYDATNMKLYVNGVLKQTTLVINGGPAFQNNDSVNSIGEDEPDGGTQLWDGRIAEVALWDSDIGATDIATLAAATARNAALDTGLITTAAKDYWELIGTTSPEPNTGSLSDGFTWIMTGTSQVAGPFPTGISYAQLERFGLRGVERGIQTGVR